MQIYINQNESQVKTSKTLDFVNNSEHLLITSTHFLIKSLKNSKILES